MAVFRRLPILVMAAAFLLVSAEDALSNGPSLLDTLRLLPGQWGRSEENAVEESASPQEEGDEALSVSAGFRLWILARNLTTT
ncbi:MAG: hypothetical protein ACYTHN_23595, partial [Planctomycetota bacterium]